MVCLRVQSSVIRMCTTLNLLKGANQKPLVTVRDYHLGAINICYKIWVTGDTDIGRYNGRQKQFESCILACCMLLRSIILTLIPPPNNALLAHGHVRSIVTHHTHPCAGTWMSLVPFTPSSTVTLTWTLPPLLEQPVALPRKHSTGNSLFYRGPSSEMSATLLNGILRRGRRHRTQIWCAVGWISLETTGCMDWLLVTKETE